MTDKPKGLHAKLAEVMAEASRIPKNGTAPAAMGGFKFVQVGDAADYIRKALGERGVSMLPTTLEIVGESEHATKSGGAMTTVALRITWTLTDGETGESTTFQSYGVGADTGDKYSGKATTTAMKYALLSGFQLSTGDDVELADTSDRRSRRSADAAVARQGVVSAPLPPRDAATTGLVGKAEVGKGDADFELRQTPDRGYRIAFKLAEGKGGFKAEAFGPLAEMIAANRPAIEGQFVTCWGGIRTEAMPPKPDGYVVRFDVLTITRLKVGALDLSAPDEPDEQPADADFDSGWLDKVPA